MRTRLLYHSLLLAIFVGGCATPLLNIPEPTEQQLVEARKHLGNTAPSEFTLPGSMEALQTEFDKAAVRVISAADRLCREVRLHSSDARCSPILLRPQLYRSQEVNAFADEHDRIGVYTGLLFNMRVRSEIAAVLAHEYAHVMLGHVQKKGSNTLTGMLVGSGLAVALASASGTHLDDRTMEAWQKLGVLAGSRAYSPEMEIEADRLAVYMLKKAEYPVTAMRDVIVRLHRLKTPNRSSGTSVGRVGFLETHPSDDRRMAHILSAVKDVLAGVPLMEK